MVTKKLRHSIKCLHSTHLGSSYMTYITAIEDHVSLYLGTATKPCSYGFEKFNFLKLCCSFTDCFSFFSGTVERSIKEVCIRKCCSNDLLSITELLYLILLGYYTYLLNEILRL
jgi:hypothetical protein